MLDRYTARSPRSFSSWLRGGVISAIVLLVASCGGGSDGPTTPTAPSGPTAVTLTAPAGKFVEQVPATFGAAVRVGGSTRPATAGEVTWSVEPTASGSITSAGVWTPARPGPATIVAAVTSAPSIRATRAVTVDSAAILSVSVAPVTGVVPGDTIAPSAVGRDAVGRDRLVVATITSTNGVLRALGGGRFRADSVGTGSLLASFGGQSAQLTGTGTVVVALGSPVGMGVSDQTVPIGTSMTLAARVQDRRGNLIPGTSPLTVLSRSPGLVSATVVSDSVRVNALVSGAARVVVSRGAVSDSFMVVVAPAAVVGLAVTPTGSRIDWRNGMPITVEGLLSDGGRMDLSSMATITTLSGEVMSWDGNRLQTTRAPFTGAPNNGFGRPRFDVGARTTVEFRYQGWRDTVDLPLHYRRPVEMTWDLGPAGRLVDTIAMVVGEERAMNWVLRDSLGAIVPVSETFGAVLPPFNSTPGLITLSPEGLIRAIFPTLIPASAGASVTYTETVILSRAVRLSITGPAPAEDPVEFLGTGYLKVVVADTLSSVVRAAVMASLARIEPIIAATPLAPVNMKLNPGVCGLGFPSTDRVVEGMEARLVIRTFDGPGGALGLTDVCAQKTGGMSLLAGITIDASDIPSLATSGNLVDVLTHELLHALGVGFFGPWSAFVLDRSVPDPRYGGVWGISAYQSLGGLDATVPVANGVGEAPGDHWRESVFGRELMT